MDEQWQDDHLEFMYNSSVPIQDIDWKTSWERWMTETGDERESGRSMLAVWHDDDDDEIELKVLQYLDNNLPAADTFAWVVKVMNHTGPRSQDTLRLKSWLGAQSQNLCFYSYLTLPNCQGSLVFFNLVWFYGISTIVGYLMPNQFLYIETVLFQTNQFDMSNFFVKHS